MLYSSKKNCHSQDSVTSRAVLKPSSSLHVEMSIIKEIGREGCFSEGVDRMRRLNRKFSTRRRSKLSNPKSINCHSTCSFTLLLRDLLYLQHAVYTRRSGTRFSFIKSHREFTVTENTMTQKNIYV